MAVRHKTKRVVFCLLASWGKQHSIKVTAISLKLYEHVRYETRAEKFQCHEIQLQPHETATGRAGRCNKTSDDGCVRIMTHTLHRRSLLNWRRVVSQLVMVPSWGGMVEFATLPPYSCATIWDMSCQRLDRPKYTMNFWYWTIHLWMARVLSQTGTKKFLFSKRPDRFCSHPATYIKDTWGSLPGG